MSEFSSAVIIKALDGLLLRQAYTAQNIANASTPHYRPMRVTFEESLRAAAQHSLDAVRNVVPSAEAAPATAETGGRLDLELATAAQTGKRYGALIELLSRQLALRHAMIMDGGR